MNRSGGSTRHPDDRATAKRLICSACGHDRRHHSPHGCLVAVVRHDLLAACDCIRIDDRVPYALKHSEAGWMAFNDVLHIVGSGKSKREATESFQEAARAFEAREGGDPAPNGRIRRREARQPLVP